MNNALHIAYWIPLLPLIGFLINGLGRKYLSKSLTGIIGSGVILAAFAMSIWVFLLVKDGNEKVLKTIRFSDGNNGSAMDCRVSDLIRFTSPVKGSLRLYYQSDEIPEGRLLLSMLGPESGRSNTR